MKCRDSVYHCLCAYLLDGKIDQEALKVIQADPQLCPKCRTCTDSDQKYQVESQKHMRLLLKKRCSAVVAPESLKNKIAFGLDKF